MNRLHLHLRYNCPSLTEPVLRSQVNCTMEQWARKVGVAIQKEDLFWVFPIVLPSLSFHVCSASLKMFDSGFLPSITTRVCLARTYACFLAMKYPEVLRVRTSGKEFPLKAVSKKGVFLPSDSHLSSERACYGVSAAILWSRDKSQQVCGKVEGKHCYLHRRTTPGSVCLQTLLYVYISSTSLLLVTDNKLGWESQRRLPEQSEP